MLQSQPEGQPANRLAGRMLHGRPMRTKLHVAGRPLPYSAPLSSQQVAIRVGEKRKRVKHTLIRNVVPPLYLSHVSHMCG